MTDALEALRTMPDESKARMRKHIRRRLGEVRVLLLRCIPADERAWLNGYLAEAERVLKAVG